MDFVGGCVMIDCITSKSGLEKMNKIVRNILTDDSIAKKASGKQLHRYKNKRYSGPKC